MKQKVFLVTNTFGFSNRAAAMFVHIAKTSKSRVWIEERGTVRDGKSILDVLDLASHHGSQITVFVEGEDEEAVMQQISDLVEFQIGLR